MTVDTEFPRLGPVVNGRVQVVGTPLVPPGKCYLCGNGAVGVGYVDMQWDIDWYGRVYFCVEDFRAVVNSIGCLTPEQSDTMSQVVLHQRTVIESLRKELERYQYITDAFSQWANSGVTSGGVTRSEIVTENASGSITGGNAKNPGTSEFDFKSRPHDFPSPTGGSSAVKFE